MSGGIAGVFYDGVAAKPRPVTLRFGAEALEILEGGGIAAHWPYAAIRRLPAAASRLRVRSLGGPALARLDVDDAAAAAELLRRSAQAEEGTTDRRTVVRIVGWSLAATASLVLTAIYLVPLAADELAPLVPVGLERRIGEAVDNQVRTLFSGKACAGAPGSASLGKLSAALASRAALPLPAEVSVLDSGIPNAVALPGGRVYLFEGLLRRAREPDEIAGILAHEFGHVARRDGMRKLIQTGGSSFLLGLLFGDITGGGTLIFLGRALVDSSYSRDAETAADRFAADIMVGLGRSPRPMGAFLVRITGAQKDMPLPFLASHPVSAERLEALEARAVAATAPPLLTEQEWRDLKSICKPG
ncbi:MAG: M48 family metallopeptidase [Microvirga sp.]